MSSRLTSAIATVILSGLVVLLMLLVSGYTFDPKQYEEKHPPKDPPEGFEIALGTNRGMDKTPSGGSMAQNVESRTAASQQNTPTQDQSDAKIATGNQNADNNTTIDQQNTTPEQPEVNTQAIADRFKELREKNKGNGQGQSTEPGTSGSENGNENATSSAGVGGNGVSGNIRGRTAENLPRPKNATGKVGRVVVAVCVNKDGRVTRAEYQPMGSNTSDGDLVKIAIASAKKSKFNATTSGDDEQCGSITYTFVNK